ncbi:transposase, mutator-like family protein [Bifidobacterium hapali]|uniref:Transposase, mutator-like family protein n=1 Tax=Bifidobacterium hapali TaxID=1630172 RepID=A0A261FWL1_9BIFI|nr:transposase, mutator-like family protein [Bifidobacterium hapali]
MSQQILQVDQAMLETTLDRMVRRSVEETLNAMLDAEADEITGAARYERSGDRKAYRACVLSSWYPRLGVVTFCWTSLSEWSFRTISHVFRRRARAGCACP